MENETEDKLFTLRQQIECVQREIGYRQRCYPRWVADGRFSQAKADYEINCMKNVLRNLQAIATGKWNFKEGEGIEW